MLPIGTTLQHHNMQMQAMDFVFPDPPFPTLLTVQHRGSSQNDGGAPHVSYSQFYAISVSHMQSSIILVVLYLHHPSLG